MHLDSIRVLQCSLITPLFLIGVAMLVAGPKRCYNFNPQKQTKEQPL
jgi:hypothetical protein